MGLGLSKILGGLLGSRKIVERVIDRVVPEKIGSAEKERLKHELAKEIEVQAGNIILAEASSADPWVSRARPTLMWIMYAVICFNYILIPLVLMAVQIFSVEMSVTLNPIQIPEVLWGMFGAGYLGYSHYRSQDKEKMIKGLLEMGKGDRYDGEFEQ